MGETETYDGPTVMGVVTWGDALTAEIGRVPGGRGLQRIVDTVDRVAGQPASTREVAESGVVEDEPAH